MTYTTNLGIYSVFAVSIYASDYYSTNFMFLVNSN